LHNHAGDADLRGRLASSGEHALSIASSTTAPAASAAPAADGLPGWNIRARRHALPSAAATAAPAEPRRRTRLRVRLPVTIRLAGR